MHSGLKVLHLLDTDAFAGTESHVLELIGELRRQGAEPLLGCRAGSELHRRAELSGLEVAPCWASTGAAALIAGIFHVCSVVRRAKIQLIHSHNGRTSLTAACASLISGIPAVATQHFIQPQFTTYRGVKWLLASRMHDLVNHQLSLVISVSEATRKAMLIREKISSEKVITVRNGIRPLLPSTTVAVKELRGQLNVPDSAVLLVSLSRLEPEKGIECLLRAFALLRNRCPESRLILAGDGSRRKMLEREAQQLSLSPFVHFLGFRQDVATVLSAADIFVLASPAEPFGLVVLEAMSIGKAVVACNAGGPVEIISDGINGRLVNPGDPVSLAIALEELVQNSKQRDQLARRGYECCRERFSAEIMGKEIMAVYAAALEPLPRNPSRSGSGCSARQSKCHV